MADTDTDTEVELDGPEIEVEIEGQEGGGAEGAATGPDVSPEEGIAALKAQLKESQDATAAANAARDDAERRAAAAAGQATDAAKTARESEIQQIDSAIEVAKQNSGILKSNYAVAAAAGDWDAAAEAQEGMAKNAAQLMALEQGKKALEDAPLPKAEVRIDPVEALASQLTPRSAAWVRAHPEFARDGRQYQRMVAAHNLAVGDGLAPDSDAYFEAVETTLKLRKTAEPSKEDVNAGDPISAAGKPAVKRGESQPAAAPPNGGGNGRQRIRLTKEQVEIAAACGQTPQQYANELARIEREKRMTVN